LYGLAEGMQYDGLPVSVPNNAKGDLVESNCFYAMYGLNDSIDELLNDFEHFITPVGEVKWFNLVGYNPIHILNNVAVGYE